MPLFHDADSSGGPCLAQPPTTAAAQAFDPMQSACVDPQLLGADFDFGPCKTSDFFGSLPTPTAADAFFSANPDFAAFSPSPPATWDDDSYPAFAQQAGSPRESVGFGLSPTDTAFSPAANDGFEDGASDPHPGASRPSHKRPGRPSARTESGSSCTTQGSLLPDGEAAPRKRGRKPRVKTDQEKDHQLQRQRQRNRLAAGRCRSKKKEETEELVHSAESLMERRDSLRSTLDGLSSEILDLKEAVMKHRYCGAGEVEAYIQRQFHQLVGPAPGSASASQNTTPELVSDDLMLSPLGSPTLSMYTP